MNDKHTCIQLIRINRDHLQGKVICKINIENPTKIVTFVQIYTHKFERIAFWMGRYSHMILKRQFPKCNQSKAKGNILSKFFENPNDDLGGCLRDIFLGLKGMAWLATLPLSW